MNRTAAILAFSLALVVAPTQGQVPGVRDVPERSTVWTLKLGAHVREMPIATFIDYACGTNGGPPSLPLQGWQDYARCRAEPATGLREVYFRYDDEFEFWARAHNLDMQIQRYQYTDAFGLPVIASALIDPDGFYVGFRLASDPRVDVQTRALGVTLGGYLMARYDEKNWTCLDLPRLEGETEYQGTTIKQRCTAQVVEKGDVFDAFIDRRLFRRRGQATIDPRDLTPTEGQFESSTWFQALSAQPIENRQQRLAGIAALGPPAPDEIKQRARDCPGCDLRGADLKRANLSGANLAGADLSGANLHAANLGDANLAGANLTRANINRAILNRAQLTNAKLREAMLYDSALNGADLSGADMSGAMAGKISLQRANLSGARLYAADLRNSRLSDANLTGADMTHAWLQSAQLMRANLSDATLIYAQARQASMVGAKLARVDARGADFDGTNLRDADLTSADFSYTVLTSVNFLSAKLERTKFIDAELPAGFVPP